MKATVDGMNSTHWELVSADKYVSSAMFILVKTPRPTLSPTPLFLTSNDDNGALG
jgi:hypothetical protein